MVKYRPERPSLSDSLKEEQYFNSIDEMTQYIFDWRNRISHYLGAEEPLKPDDIIISSILYDDPRIGWKNVRKISVRKTIDTVYPVPQCIGFCGE